MADNKQQPKHTPLSGDRRKSARWRNRSATTLFGEVFDLSTGGMQVFRKGSGVIEIDECLDIELQCEHLSATLPVRVVRRECVGFRRVVYGVEFVGLDAVQQTKLQRLVESACEPCACPSCWVAA